MDIQHVMPRGIIKAMIEEVREDTIFVTDVKHQSHGNGLTFELVRHHEGRFEEYTANGMAEVLACAYEFGAKYLVTREPMLLCCRPLFDLNILAPEVYAYFATQNPPTGEMPIIR